MSVVSFPANTTTLLVNTLFTSKIVYLPAISTVNMGSMYYIKDICGNAATLPIYIYPSGTDTLENSSATYTIINVNFGSIMVTPDGISNWMILQNYNTNAIAKRWNAAPAPPASLSLTYNPLTTYLTASWTKSGYAATYAVAIYTNSSATTVGATSFQSYPSVTTLTVNTTNAISQTYYYATVTATNPLGTSVTTTSPFLQVVYLPLVPSAVTAVFSFPLLSCTWSTGTYATSYTIIFYYNLTASRTGGTAAQIFTGNTGTSQTASIALINAYYYYATVTSVNSSGNSAIVTSSNTVQTTILPGPITSVTVSFSFPNSSAFPTIVCTWTASLNATYYNIVYYYIATPGVSGGTSFENDPNITALTYSTTTLPTNNIYYYATVTAFNAYGQNTTVTSGSYTQAILYPLSTTSVTVSLYFPTYSATPAIICTWASVTTAATYTVIFYQNNSASTSGGTTFETDTLQTGITKSTTTSLVINKYYYATVKAINTYGESSAVLSTSYVKANLAPLPTTTVSITFSFPTYSSTPTITCIWSSVATATTYTIIFYETVSPATTGGTAVETNTGKTGTSFTSAYTLVNGDYYYATVTSVNIYDFSTAVTSFSYVQAYMTALPTASVAISFSFPTYSSTPSFTCTWSSVATAATYTIKFYQTLSPATTGGTLAESNTGKTGTSYTSLTVAPTNLYYYYATVTSVNTYNPSVEVTGASYVQAYMTALPTTSVTMSFSYPTITCTWVSVATAATYTIIFYSNTQNLTTGGTVFETDTGKTGTSFTATNQLVNGSYYYATVTSVNSYLPSTPVTSTSAILPTLAPGTSTVSVSFVYPNIVATWSATTQTNTYTVVFYQTATAVTTGGTEFERDPGLTGTTKTSSTTTLNNYYYYAIVTSVNPYTTTSVTSSNSVLSLLLPSPPPYVSVGTSGAVFVYNSPQSCQVTINASWQATANTTSYYVVLSGTTSQTVSTTSASFTIAASYSYSTTATYTVTVYSVNAAGQSATGTSGSTTYSTPGPPPPTLVNPVINVGVGALTTNISWSGWSGATSYSVGADFWRGYYIEFLGTASASTSGTSTTVTNLNPHTGGVLYYLMVTVTGINAYGSVSYSLTNAIGFVR